LYINDLPQASNFFPLLFADDTTLLDSDDDIEALTSRVNKEFKKICDFFRANRLVLHPKKTNFVIFSHSGIEGGVDIVCNSNNGDEMDPALIQSITRISHDNSTKFLGVQIDDKLSFIPHISNIRNKLSKSLYLLRTSSNFLDTESLKLLYYSTFHSHLIYAIQLWSCSSNTQINSIFAMQKKAIRIVAKKKYNSHTEPIFKQLAILPLPDLVSYFKIQFMHRYVNNLLPSAFTNIWPLNVRNIGENDLQLRNFNELTIRVARSNFCDRLPLFDFPKSWVRFADNSIKKITSVKQFDANLKLFFLNDLADSVNCGRLFCPSCSV
jgi:hypothetical protein